MLKNNNYNQYEDRYTRNACGIVSLLNIMKYRYAVMVAPNFLMKIAIFFDNLWLWNPDNWAVFSVLYKWFVIVLNKKLWLKFKVVTNQISTLSKNDDRTYWLGIKWYSTPKYRKIREDWIVTIKEIDYLCTFRWWVGHNIIWDWTGPWYAVDTDGSKAFKISLPVLKYWYEKWLFWNNIRTIEPDNEFTKNVVKATISLFQAEKKWRLNQWYEKNKHKDYVVKAYDLYTYWQKNANK